MNITYIERYSDKHLSYLSDKYDCGFVHDNKDIVRILEMDYLSVDRLYYHLIIQKRNCCLNSLLNLRILPSSFCIVRIFKFKYNYATFIYNRLSNVQKSRVFIRMIDELLYIPEIHRDITEYNPTLWVHFCSDLEWSDISEYLDEHHHFLYNMTISSQHLPYYKYLEHYPVKQRYKEFLDIDMSGKDITKIINEFTDSSETMGDPSEMDTITISVFKRIYDILKKDHDQLDIILYSRIFYELSMSILNRSKRSKLRELQQLIEESLRDIMDKIKIEDIIG